MVEERTEERETFSMGQEDKPSGDAELKHGDKTGADAVLVEPSSGLQSSSPLPSMPSRPGDIMVDSVFDDEVDSSFLATMEGQVDMRHDPGQSAPVTPPTTSMQLRPTPRQQHETRAHGPDDTEDHELKRTRWEAQKKQRIAKMMEYNESMIRTVKVGADEFATLDDYENELDLDAGTPEDDFWCDEDQLRFDNVPDALWSNAPLDKQPQAPEAWIDALADAVEIDRLLKMGVLQKAENAKSLCQELSPRGLFMIGGSKTALKMDASKQICRQGICNPEAQRHVFTCNWITYIQLGSSCLLKDVGWMKQVTAHMGSP